MISSKGTYAPRKKGMFSKSLRPVAGSCGRSAEQKEAANEIQTK
jgi:hypothetical protein